MHVISKTPPESTTFGDGSMERIIVSWNLSTLTEKASKKWATNHSLNANCFPPCGLANVSLVYHLTQLALWLFLPMHACLYQSRITFFYSCLVAVCVSNVDTAFYGLTSFFMCAPRTLKSDPVAERKTKSATNKTQSRIRQVINVKCEEKNNIMIIWCLSLLIVAFWSGCMHIMWGIKKVYMSCFFIHPTFKHIIPSCLTLYKIVSLFHHHHKLKNIFEQKC